MKILAIADIESKYYYDFYEQGRLDDIDLILACGDLDKRYLEFLVTMAKCPLLYVCGNHDDGYQKDPPEGCICIEDQIYEYQGVRFLGLGGSYRYTARGIYMHSELAMCGRIAKLWPKLFLKNGFDVLVTHAPAAGLGDLEDLPHKGFECFVRLLDRFKPKYFIHGHVHRNYGMKIPAVTKYEDTIIINAFEYHIFEY